MTYNVSMGTLNPTIPYHTLLPSFPSPPFFTFPSFSLPFLSPFLSPTSLPSISVKGQSVMFFTLLPAGIVLLTDWFFGFSPTGVTCCTDQGEIWQGGAPLLPAKFHFDRLRGVGLRPTKKLTAYALTYPQILPTIHVDFTPLDCLHDACGRINSMASCQFLSVHMLNIFDWLIDSLQSRWTVPRRLIKNDVYDAVFVKVKDDLKTLKRPAVCIMFDSWPIDDILILVFECRRPMLMASGLDLPNLSVKVLEKQTDENMAFHHLMCLVSFLLHDA